MLCTNDSKPTSLFPIALCHVSVISMKVTHEGYLWDFTLQFFWVQNPTIQQGIILENSIIDIRTFNLISLTQSVFQSRKRENRYTNTGTRQASSLEHFLRKTENQNNSTSVWSNSPLTSMHRHRSQQSRKRWSPWQEEISFVSWRERRCRMRSRQSVPGQGGFPLPRNSDAPISSPILSRQSKPAVAWPSPAC